MVLIKILYDKILKIYIYSNCTIGGEQYVVQVKVHTEIDFLMGKSGEARVVELYSDFIVNGVSGWGVAEWEYRNVNGKPATPKAVET